MQTWPQAQAGVELFDGVRKGAAVPHKSYYSVEGEPPSPPPLSLRVRPVDTNLPVKTSRIRPYNSLRSTPNLKNKTPSITHDYAGTPPITASTAPLPLELTNTGGKRMPLTMPYARPLTTASGRSELPVSPTAAAPAASPSPLLPPSFTRPFPARRGEAPRLPASSGSAVCCFDAADADAGVLSWAGAAWAFNIRVCTNACRRILARGRRPVGRGAASATAAARGAHWSI